MITWQLVIAQTRVSTRERDAAQPGTPGSVASLKSDRPCISGPGGITRVDRLSAKGQTVSIEGTVSLTAFGEAV